MADELKSLEDLLAIITHDLRTPLAVVHTTTTMLMNPKYQLGPEQVREQYERIRRNVDVMNQMLGELSDLTHLRTGKFSVTNQPVLIDEVLREAVAAQEKTATEKGLTISLEGGSATLTAGGDRTRLLQAFQTLLGYAIRSGKDGDRIAVTSSAHGGQAQIDIASAGAILAPEDLAQVFDPYHSNSGCQKSRAGLAMYIAKGIVDAHQGQIRVNSQAGTGTTFSVTLPLAV
jgi:signal transduction histidine kinase